MQDGEAYGIPLLTPTRQGRPELERAVREATSSLARLQPKHSGSSRKAPLKPPVVHEAKRKPIRAALLAGVKPTQVAKHFGVPLTLGVSSSQ